MRTVTAFPRALSGSEERRIRVAVGATLSLALVLAGVPRARAAAAEDDPAQRLFNQGVAAARENRWSEAREAFSRAYGLSQRPVVLINLAAAEVRTGRLKDAAIDYRRILEGDATPETAAFRKAAADVLPALEARIPRIRLHAMGLGATDVVEIDGETISSDRLEEPSLVDPGAHAVVVKRSGVERSRVSFSVAEGESHDISVSAPLDPQMFSAPATPVDATPGVDLSASPSAQSSAPSSRRSRWRSPWLWAAVAAVSVGATVATVFAVHSHDETFSGNLSPGTVVVH
jgi:hypothetical protein